MASGPSRPTAQTELRRTYLSACVSIRESVGSASDPISPIACAAASRTFGSASSSTATSAGSASRASQPSRPRFFAALKRSAGNSLRSPRMRSGSGSSSVAIGV